MTDILDTLALHPLIAILRSANAFVPGSGARNQAGFRFEEFILTTGAALAALKKLPAALPAELILGIGIVRAENQIAESVGGVELHEVGYYLDKGAVAIGRSGPLIEDAPDVGRDPSGRAHTVMQIVAAR